MATMWQLKSRDKIHGPFSSERLRQLLREGRINAQTQVRLVTGGAWMPVRDAMLGSKVAKPVDEGIESLIDEVLLSENPSNKNNGLVGSSNPMAFGAVESPMQMPTSRDSERQSSPHEEIVFAEFKGNELENDSEMNSLQSEIAITRRNTVKALETEVASLDLGVKDASEDVETRPCPFCAETIKVAAIKCKHCGELLNASQTHNPIQPQRNTQPIIAVNAPSDGSETCKTSTILCVILALLVPLWPISLPLFLALAFKTYKDPS